MGNRSIATTLVALAALSLVGFQRARSEVATVTEGVTYVRRGDGPLLLDIYRPASGTGHPVVLLVHGGSWKMGGRASFAAVGRELAAEGFVAFSIDYRLTAPGGDASWPEPLDDVRAAFDWVSDNATRYGGDPARIGVLGSSAGGHLSLMLGAGDRRPRAVAAWSPPVDLAALASTGLGDDIARLMGCAVAECPERWNEASPNLHVNEGMPPTFLAYSTDEFIPLDQRDALVGALGDRGVPFEERIVEGRAHGMQLSSEVLAVTVAFLRDNLAAR